MAKKYLDENGVLYFWQKIKTKLSEKVDKEAGKGLSTNDYTTAEKDKLGGIQEGANKTIVDTSLSSSSTNPVQNKIIKAELDTKVDKESGKGLSTNDYTTPEKNKLGGIESGAQVNIIETIQKNGVPISASNKTVNIIVPTNTNELTNGAGFQNATQVNALISAALADVAGIDFQIVESLPSTGKKGTIYLVSNSGIDNNIYDEYIWVNNKFEMIGTTAVDLSGYLKSTDLIAITNGEIDTIVAS